MLMQPSYLVLLSLPSRNYPKPSPKSVLACTPTGLAKWHIYRPYKGLTSVQASKRGSEVCKGGFFFAISRSDLRVTPVVGGHASYSFRVPAHLMDIESNWKAGAIAYFGVAAVLTTALPVRGINVTVDSYISYSSPAKFDVKHYS